MPKRPTVYLTREQVNQMMDYADNDRDRAIVRLFYETGCKLNELVSLDKKDISFSKNEIRFGSEKRKVKISQKLTRTLYKLSSKNDGVLSTRQSKNPNERRIQQILQKVSEKSISTSISPQDLRATHIIHSFLDDNQIEEIEKKVGVSIKPYIYEYFKRDK